jgi:protein-disulfide isomerase-like protein with CxxC motif
MTNTTQNQKTTIFEKILLHYLYRITEENTGMEFTEEEWNDVVNEVIAEYESEQPLETLTEQELLRRLNNKAMDKKIELSDKQIQNGETYPDTEDLLKGLLYELEKKPA